MNELLASNHSDSKDDDELQLSRCICRCNRMLVQEPIPVPGLSPIGVECSFAHWFLCFPKFHWRWIETSLSRQVLDGMVGKVSESKESAKIRIKLKFCKIF